VEERENPSESRVGRTLWSQLGFSRALKSVKVKGRDRHWTAQDQINPALSAIYCSLPMLNQNRMGTLP
jgi:hypothetical protein